MMNGTDEVARLLRRTNVLLTVLANAALADVREAELSNPTHRALYRLTGTDVPVKEIAKKLRMAVGTISATWQRWEEQGLLVRDGRRYRRVLDE